MKLPRAYTRNPEVARLGADAFRLHLSALDWCSEHKTNGAIERGDLALLPNVASGRKLESAIVELEQAGLWAQVGNVWLVGDAERVDVSLSDKRAEAGRRGGLAKALAIAKQTASKLPPGDVASCQPVASLAGGAAPSSLELSPLNQASQALVLSGFSPDSSALSSSDQGPDRLPARAANSRRSKPRTEAPDTLEPTPRHQQIAAERGIDLAVETERCLAHHRGKGNLQANWNAVLTTWLLSPYAKAGTQQPASKVPGQNFNRLNARIARMELEEAEREAH